MKTKLSPNIVRRSVALPRQLVEEVSALAPPELRQNLNRLVTVALREFAAQQKARAFEEAMALMAADPAINAECAAISRDFATTETDGLKND
jgi:metal-responsive CopG/Arc/MetJ family transcriptional regulator